MACSTQIEIGVSEPPIQGQYDTCQLMFSLGSCALATHGPRLVLITFVDVITARNWLYMEC